ncbi:MAG: Bifunctional ligase/repressor BirA [Alphaproteobacteria bacterium MarineAlpha9_Bin4]|nr:MAG: Bifunctional ligase/repressor BirA [Alphaproteobacteria bacterium MarineAlpha9_Bin4]
MIKKKYISKKIPLFFLDTVDSTMNEVKRSKYETYYDVAILAKKQTNGRGRRQNIWISEKGNLYLSIRLKKRIKSNHHLVTYMASIIVYDVIKKYLPKKVKTFIKWPNDIYINNKKVAGILIEFLSKGNIITDVIIGVGININNNPQKYIKSSTYLSKYSNIKIKSIDLAKSILLGLDYWTKILSTNRKIILKEWMSRSRRLNTNIKFYYDNKILSGVYKGIHEDGSIKILMEDKIKNFFNLELT